MEAKPPPWCWTIGWTLEEVERQLAEKRRSTALPNGTPDRVEKLLGQPHWGGQPVKKPFSGK